MSFDGGDSYLPIKSCPIVWSEDKNHSDLQNFRDVWKWAKNAGGVVIFEEN